MHMRPGNLFGGFCLHISISPKHGWRRCGSYSPLRGRSCSMGVVESFGKLALMLVKSFAMLEIFPGIGSSFLWC